MNFHVGTYNAATLSWDYKKAFSTLVDAKKHARTQLFQGYQVRILDASAGKFIDFTFSDLNLA